MFNHSFIFNSKQMGLRFSIVFSAALLLIPILANAQEVSPETLAKRAKRKNLTVKEWNVEQSGSTRWMDHLKIYDNEGRCIESIEYAKYGQKERIVTQYNEKGLIAKEIVYDDRNKVVRVRKYEYNPDGTKSKQYNYLPNGKLYSVKNYEYFFAD